MNMNMYEPTDLDLYMMERASLRVCVFGPLTRDEHEMIERYEAHMEAEERENDAYMAAGRRSICPKCGERSVRDSAVVTLGYAGHPGAEWSQMYECENSNCDYKDM
jgi:hypothetical protein